MTSSELKIYTAVIITGIIIGIIILFFIISIVRQQRRNIELHRKSVQAEITAMEKERARIASDLHDELGPMLSAIKMKINSFELPDEDDQVEIVKTNEHIDSMLKRMREISYDLMPESLLRKGIIAAVREFTNLINRSNEIEIELYINEEVNLSEYKTINLYRIVQEIIHNTIKHSKATLLVLKIEIKKNNVVFTAKDNGVGFNHKNEKETAMGFGLRSLLNRTEMMNGKMFLESKKGEGTIYSFEIPVK